MWRRSECKTAKTTKWTTLGREIEREQSEWKQQPLNISYDPIYSNKPHGTTTTTTTTLTRTHVGYKTDWMQYLPLLVWLKLLSKNVKNYWFRLWAPLWAMGTAIIYCCTPFLCVHRDDVLFSFSLSLPNRPTTLLPHTIFPVQLKILRIDVSIVIWLNATFN